MTMLSGLGYSWGPERHARIAYLSGGRTLLTRFCGEARPRNAAADTQASRQAKHWAHMGILIEQSVLGTLQLWNETKVCTKKHQGMYTGGLSHGLG